MSAELCPRLDCCTWSAGEVEKLFDGRVWVDFWSFGRLNNCNCFCNLIKKC